MNPIRNTRQSIVEGSGAAWGVKWVKTITNTYDVAALRDIFKGRPHHEGKRTPK